MRAGSWIIGLVLGAALLDGGAHAAAPQDNLSADAAACAALEGNQIGPARIVAATFVRTPYRTRWMLGGTATATVPFCRLEAYAEPVARSHIELEVWVPVRAKWNGRFLGIGAGGSMGAVNTADLADGVNRGFAAVATDNGHRSPAPSDGNQWALGETERIVDFGHRANHIATEAGKAAVRAYYGRAPEFSYFVGCSQGGQKAMMEAQRYPEDYDGILAGAPVYSWVNLMSQQAWGVRALTETPRSTLSLELMRALQDAARQRCAGPDGLIADPRRCDFDPAQLQCSDADGGKVCLTPEQVAAARKLYEGPTGANGRKFYPGMPRGGERGWNDFYLNVKADGSSGGGSWYGVYRFMVFEDAGWTLPQLSFERDPAQAKRKLGPMLDADNPDLDAFARRGGKLIVYHGWADQEVPPATSTEYHDAVVARTSRERVDQYFRLFMVPGMAHCEEEVTADDEPIPHGPNLSFQRSYDSAVPFTPENDALTALQLWVESRRAPSQFVVRVADSPGGIKPRTVRTCADPARAVFRGQGDPLDAANWECRAEP